MYTIDFSDAKMVDGLIEVKINEPILFNDSYGDRIGIDKESNVLWFSPFLDLEDDEDGELNEWFRSTFKNYQSVRGFVRRNL